MKINVPISSKNQVTIPKEIRKLLGIKSGDRLVFAEEYGRIFLEVQSQLTSCPVCEGRGEFEDSGRPCFICYGTGVMDENFMVLNRLNKWLEVYNVKAEYLIKSQTKSAYKTPGIGQSNSTFFIPSIEFHSKIYTESELKGSQDFALISLVDFFNEPKENVISYDQYIELRESLCLESSKRFLSHYEIKELK